MSKYDDLRNNSPIKKLSLCQTIFEPLLSKLTENFALLLSHETECIKSDDFAYVMAFASRAPQMIRHILNEYNKEQFTDQETTHNLLEKMLKIDIYCQLAAIYSSMGLITDLSACLSEQGKRVVAASISNTEELFAIVDALLNSSNESEAFPGI